MKVLSRSVFLVVFCLSTVALQANVAPAAPDEVRSQLSSYFKNIQKNSPTVLGGLSKSPEAMAAIQERIASMSDAEAAKFQKVLAETPDWKVAPEAFAGAFPPEVLEQIQRVGADYAAQVPKGEKMRDDVRTLVEVLKLLPDEKLKDLAIDRKMIDSLAETFTQMSPLQTAMLRRHAGETTPWGETSALAIHTLPPALQRGAAALSAHGAFTPEDITAIELFRHELIGLLERIDRLPPAAREKLKTDGLVNQTHQLRLAPTDVIFMVRHNMTPEMLKDLRTNIAYLERVSSFSDKEKKDLEVFRRDLGRAFKQVKPAGATGEWQEAGEMLAGLGPEHLFMMQKQMETYGQWQTALPVVYQMLAAPETGARLRAVQGATPDTAAVQSLELFRHHALIWIDTAGRTSGLDVELVAKARQIVETAPVDRLEMIRMVAERMPATATAADKLSVVLLHEINFGCSATYTIIPQVCVPEICVGGCETVLGVEVCIPRVCTPAGCTPAVTASVSFDLICNPIEDALETVEHSIVGTANGIVETMRSGIQTAINGVQTAINNSIAAVNNVINTAISAITTTVNDVWTFLQTLPGKTWDAIKAAMNLLLDINIGNGVTLRNLLTQGTEQALNSMKTLLGLTNGWWNAVSGFTLPAIPCPPAGMRTPFGNVGDSGASDNYARYRLLIDGIVGMIPDTEISLAIKIPAQTLYMMFDFFGLCLEQAAANADSDQLTARHNLVLANFSNVQSFVGQQLGVLGTLSGTQTGQIVDMINGQASTTRTTIMGESQIIQTLLSQKSATIQSLVETESTEIQNLLQTEGDDLQDAIEAFRKLNLRLTIERVLQAGVPGEIGHFQLRSPWGHLQLVSQIVRMTIDAMTVAQEGIGQAQRFYEKGVELMNAGKDKDAFEQFSMAYREASK